MIEKKVYIVVLNYNGWEDTIECLESIFKSNYNNYSIVVVDNDSPNNSMDYLIKWAEGEQNVTYKTKSILNDYTKPNFKKPLSYSYYLENNINSDSENNLIFIQANKNNGFSAGNNIGIRYALTQENCEYIWLLNNDIIIQYDTIQKLVDSYKNQKKSRNIGIIGTIQNYYHNPEKIQASAGKFNKWSGKFWNCMTLDFTQDEIAYPYGASMFFHKSTFQKIGLMDENYFIYCEEIDITERLKQEKMHVYIDKNIVIYHKHGQSMKTIENDLQFYYSSRSKIYFYKKFYKRYLPFAYLRVFYSKFRRFIAKLIRK